MSDKGPPHWRTKSTRHLHAVPSTPPVQPAPTHDWWDPVATNTYWRAKERREDAERATKVPASPASAEAWRLQHEREYRLVRHLDGWRRAKEIRAYVAELRTLLGEFDCEPPIGDEGDLSTWLAWCEEQANRLDPLSLFRRHMATTRGRELTERRAGEEATREVVANSRKRKPTN